MQKVELFLWEIIIICRIRAAEPFYCLIYFRLAENFDIDRILARLFSSNIRSQRILEKLGFELEARFEKTIWKKDHYEDELVYAIRRNN